MDSILTSVKKMLGIETEYEHFDADILMHINSVFSVLTQLGVGPASGPTPRSLFFPRGIFFEKQIGLVLEQAYEFIDIGCLFISFRQMECLSEFS